MRTWNALVVAFFVLCGCVCGIASGQTFNIPRFYVWGNYPGGYSCYADGPTGCTQPAVWEHYPATHDPYMTHVIWVYTAGTATPVDSARLAARYIKSRIDFGNLLPNEVCLSITQFGFDDSIQSGTMTDLPLRFFCSQDRLHRADGTFMTDAQFPLSTPPGPQGQGDIDARTYRHPFLRNAVLEVPGGDVPPLRAWMKQFVTEWQEIKTNPNHPVIYYPQLPDPSRVYMDTETWIAAPPNINGLFMLRYLAHENPVHTMGTQTGHVWTELTVPGYPAGTTLEVLYAQAVADPAYGFPAPAPNGTPPHRGIDAPSGGLDIDPAVLASSPQNRKFAQWWYSILNRVTIHIMDNCMYDVVRATWPNAKYGNYDETRVDGVKDATGWFTDWKSPYLNDPNNNSLLPISGNQVEGKNEYPRGWLWLSGETSSRQWNTPLGRWLAQSQYGKGTVDSPVFYEFAPGFQFDRYQQMARYVPPGRCAGGTDCPETTHQTTQRIGRWLCESVINSLTATHPNGMRSDLLVPWVDMAKSPNPNEPADQRRTVFDFQIRANLGTIRSKNLKDTIFFLSPNAELTLTDREIARDVWGATSIVVKRVYASRVAGFARTTGAAPPNSDSDVSRLEFTLRDSSGQDRTVDIQTAPVSELKVTINGLAAYRSCWQYEINVECQVTSDGVKGMLMVWDYSRGEWVVVPVLVRGEEAGTTGTRVFDYDYGFHTPDRSSRRVFNLIDEGSHYVSSSGEMILKLVHVQGQGLSVWSKYDLVQVIPYKDPTQTCSVPGTSFAQPLAVSQSDKNYDTFVDAGDLLAFLDDYAQSKLSADIDNDGDVDVDDLVLYMAYYVNES